MNVVDVAPEILKLVDDLVADGRVTDPRTPKGRLLAKAAKLFRVKGYERTTVRDLAAAVGIQSGSIFHHFKSKEEILLALMREVIVFNTSRMQSMLASSDNPKEKVLNLIRCELEAINGLTGNAMSVLVYEWRSLNKDNQKQILVLRDIYEQLWLDTLAEAKEQGMIVADVFALRRYLMGAISWSTTWYDPKGDMTLETMAREALTLAIK